MALPGRTRPSAYAYGAHALAAARSVEAETLWIAGGLYGNTCALDALLAAYERDRGRKALVFNGDFHWFDVAPHDFELVNEVALAYNATRGNVETELAMPQPGIGCGCAYPQWVDEETVQRSNRIIERLRVTARSVPHAVPALAMLPMYLAARVGARSIGIVHGDAESLAGWGFSQETLATQAGVVAARAAFDAAGVDVFASSHTCLPVLQAIDGRIIVNNGAAGMPNFRGESCGLATRIALSPAKESVYGTRLDELFIDAVPVRYDAAAWERRFLEQWPEGSDAHASYYRRIVDGPGYPLASALRGTAIAASAACART